MRIIFILLLLIFSCSDPKEKDHKQPKETENLRIAKKPINWITITNDTKDIIVEFRMYTNIPHPNGMAMIREVTHISKRGSVVYSGVYDEYCGYSWTYRTRIHLNNHYTVLYLDDPDNKEFDVYSPAITGKPMDWRFRDASAVFRRAEKAIGKWKKQS